MTTPRPDIDWLRSVTTVRTTRRARQPDDTDVLHQAMFGIKPETVADVASPYSRTGEHFRPEFLTAKWVNGAMSEVDVSGSLRRKNGGVSAKVNRHREWRAGWADGERETNAAMRSRLPEAVADALLAYETTVAEIAAGATK